MQSARDVVNLVVGGNNFCFKKEDLERFPESYFAHFLKDEWRYDKSDDIYIDRDGWLFGFVYAYIASDALQFKLKTLGVETLIAIRREADFYNLPGMTAMCDQQISAELKEWCKNFATCAGLFSRFSCEPEYSSEVSHILRTLNEMLRPAAATTSTCSLVFPVPNYTTFPVPKTNNALDVTKHFPLTVSVSIGNFLPIHKQDGQKLSCQTKFYLYATDSYCKQRVPMFSTEQHLLKGYVLLIPRACVFTGGKITAVGSGQTKSIELPGESMILQAGMSYSVETVTSGRLFLMETVIYIEPGVPEPLPPHVVPSNTLNFGALSTYRRSSTISAERRISLTTALEVELTNYPAGVIICLTSLYPITHSPDPDNNHIYTDLEALKGRDAEFYTMLCEEYTVSVVTVFLCRTNTLNTDTTATTSSASTPTTSTANTNTILGSTLVGCIVDSSLPEMEEGAIYKIVPVVYGYGEIFRLDDQKLGTLLTGLLVAKKVVVK
eukprot:gene16210-18502_t